jgi:hypothetical protein
LLFADQPKQEPKVKVRQRVPRLRHDDAAVWVVTFFHVAALGADSRRAKQGRHVVRIARIGAPGNSWCCLAGNAGPGVPADAAAPRSYC